MVVVLGSDPRGSKPSLVLRSLAHSPSSVLYVGKCSGGGGSGGGSSGGGSGGSGGGGSSGGSSGGSGLGFRV